MTARKPPHDLQAEEVALGAAMLTADALAVILEQIGEQDFYRPAHRTIYRAVRDLAARGAPVDPVTVGAELGRVGTLADVGGAPFLHTLVAGVPTAAHAAAYAATVAELGSRRRLIDAGHRIVQTGLEEPDTGKGASLAQEILAGIIAAGRASACGMDGLEAAWLAFLEQTSTGQVAAWGLLDLDRLTGGLRPGQLAVAAGRPGMGKTSLSLQVAAHNAAAGHVIVASYEMSLAEVYVHLLAATGTVTIHEAMTMAALEADIGAAVTQLRTLDLTVIDDCPDAASLVARVHAAHRRRPARLVVVDYLQLISVAGEATTREQEVAACSRALKRLAMTSGLPVLVAAQLNREAASRTDKQPRLTDLRESGAIENDADLVVLLHRPDYYDPESPRKGEVDLIVAKQRMGPTDCVTFQWDGPHGRFRDLTRLRRVL